MKKDLLASAWVGIFLFFLLLFFTHNKFYGYEGETYGAMETFVRSGNIPFARAGLMSILSHLPFALLRTKLDIGFAPFMSMPFYTALVGSVFFILAKNIYDSRKAFCLTLILVFSTMFLPYSVFGMEHIFALTTLSGFTSLFLYSKRKNIYLLLLSGIFAGLASQTKSYGILFLIPALVYLFLVMIDNKTEQKKQINNLLVFIFPALFIFGLGLLYNYLHSGQLLSSAYDLDYELQPISLWVGLYGLFFSVGKSFFIYNPAVIGSFIFLKKFISSFRNEFIFIAVLFGVYTVFTAKFSFWTDEVWGPRKLLVLVPFALLPLGFCFDKISKAKSAMVAILILAGFYFNFLGAIYDYGKQLTLLRKMNADSLQSMRYTPELNHISVNSLLFKSRVNKFLYGKQLHFSYEEQSWMRQLGGKNNILLQGGTVDLDKYDNFDAVLFRRFN